MVDKRDLNLQLCSDDPIFVGGVPIYPIPISEIAKIGYMRFNAEVRLLCLSESDISAMTGNDISDIGVFKYLVANAMRDQGLMNTILFWLSIITHSRMKFSSVIYALLVAHSTSHKKTLMRYKPLSDFVMACKTLKKRKKTQITKLLAAYYSVEKKNG